MKTSLFYFSGTGNSLWASREIARRLGETELISIPEVVNGPVEVETPRIGIVFPVHMFGVPGMIIRFIENLTVPRDAYVFAVATCGGMACATLKQTARLLAVRDMTLAAGFSLPMVNSCTTVAEAPPPEKQRALLERAGRRIEEVCSAIENRTRHIHGGIPGVNYLFDRLVYRRAFPKVPGLSRQYHTDETCNGCGICARVCPVNNISMNGDKPEWESHCEACFACMQWCPKESIQFADKTAGRRRYHHPEMRVTDIATPWKIAA